MDISNTQKNEYLLIINGVIPEALPLVAYRRTERNGRERRKIIKCPHCREALTDVDRNTTVQIFRRKKVRQKNLSPYPHQIFMKCDSCKNEIGIIMNMKGFVA